MSFNSIETSCSLVLYSNASGFHSLVIISRLDEEPSDAARRQVDRHYNVIASRQSDGHSFALALLCHLCRC